MRAFPRWSVGTINNVPSLPRYLIFNPFALSLSKGERIKNKVVVD
ncbi:MAG: hypothetical protein WC091_07625 [Sulfuricellaceae bacterium]